MPRSPRPRSTARLVTTTAAAASIIAACAGSDASDRLPSDSNTPGEAAAPPVLDADVFAVVGDAGELDDDTLAVADLVAAHGAATVLTVGDNDYAAEGRTVESYEESVGAVYGAWVDAGAFFPIPGDHDYGDQCDDPDASSDLDAYLEFFDLPTGPEDETYYDVRIGDVHVFALDSLVDCHRDGGAKLARQRGWLAATATESDAALQVVLLHNPPYSSGASHGSVESLRWDFAAWGVDLVVSGDDHIYERSTHDGVHYVVNGLGGVELHELGDPIDGSEVLYADQFGALLVSVTPSAADVSFVAVDGTVVDRFSIPLEVAVSAAPVGLDAGSTWHWQLQGELDTSVDADVYDIDLFETAPATIEALRAEGRFVVCYFSAGSYEGWRPDADAIAPVALGETLAGFADERWLDVRDPSVRLVVEQRLDLAVDRGCDGVEPDNVDGYANDTGFDLTADDQLDFNRFLAAAAHDRGLLVGLKNDLDQIPELVDVYDFAVNEQCHEFDECDAYEAFAAQGKPVFNAEYDQRFVDDPADICRRSLQLGLRTLVLPLDLDGSFRIACDG